MDNSTLLKICALVGETEYEQVRCRNGVKLKLRDCHSAERFSAVVDKLRAEFGSADFVHSYYGYIWSTGGGYVACNLVEEGYNAEVAAIFLFDKFPAVKKLLSSEYNEINDLVRGVLLKEGFYSDDGILHYCQNAFRYLAESDCAQCVLIISARKVKFYYLVKAQIADG